MIVDQREKETGKREERKSQQKRGEKKKEVGHVFIRFFSIDDDCVLSE